MARSGPVPFALLVAAACLSAIGARAIDPLLSVLAEDFHSSIAAVSVVIAAFTLPYGAVQVVIGPLADRWGKLRVMAGITLAFGLAMAACALAATLWQLSALRALTGAAAAGLVPLSLAYVGDALPYEQRQIAMSRISAGYILGQMLAGPVAGVFGDTLGWRGVFLAVGGVGLLMFGVLAWRACLVQDAPVRRQMGWARYRRLAGRPEARVLLLASMVEGVVFAGSFPFIAPFLRAGWDLSASTVGLVLACFGVGGLAYAAVARRMVPVLGERGLVLLGGALLTAGMGGAASLPSWGPCPVLEVMLGFGYMTAHGVLLARATELLPEARSTAMSVFALMLFIGQSLGAVGLGEAVGLIGYRNALSLVAIGMAAMTLWLTWIVRAPAQQTLRA